MPELPEVETIARGVDKGIRGDRIVQVWFDRHPQPFKTPRSRQARELAGRTIVAVHRSGKHIVFELSSSGTTLDAHKPGAHTPDAREREALRPSAQWIVHLGMTGRLLVTTPESPVALHTHARLTLESGRELRFVDPRRFGRLEFRDLRRGAAFGAPGDEPLTIGEREFAALFRGRRTSRQLC
jgi:formamidopyrimidine-DNA glycosylase